MNYQEKDIEKLVQKAHFSLRLDVKKVLEKAYRKERQARAKKALGWILENAKIARQKKIALCQDTGLAILFIEAGSQIKLKASWVDNLKKAITRSYENNHLRRSITDPILRKNPRHQGIIEHIQFLPGSRRLKVTLLPKGFGSENKSQLKMFDPTTEMEEIENFIVAGVKKAGPEGCPPFFVGVGIGGTSDYALFLAKKALSERIDSPNLDKKLNLMEKRTLNKINQLGIGPMGLGGKTTALAVKIKKCPTHIAGLPVGVNIGCHALRSATLNIKVKR